MTESPDQTEDVVQSLANYERLAIRTGEWEGTEPPTFSDGKGTWQEFWITSENGAHPALARAVVHRAGVRPVAVTIAWDEHVPEQKPVAPGETDWFAKWNSNPMSLFGAAALRRAYQRAFRDVIGESRRQVDVQESPVAPEQYAATETESGASSNDWHALVLDATTPDEVSTVLGWAKESDELSDDLRTVGLTRAGVLARQARASA